MLRRLAFGVLIWGALATAAAATEVDVALVLAMDGSGSVDDERWDLQRRGYGEALRSDAFLEAVKSGHLGRIAVTFVEWSTRNRQRQDVPWTVIEDRDTARRFAAALTEQRPRDIPGWTSISGAIDYAARLLRESGNRAGRQVIDISGDGRSNDGRDVTAARDEAVAAGITINGLPILGVEAGLDVYYRDNVIGGAGAFLVAVEDDRSFSRAVLKKLVAEVAGVPADAPSLARAESLWRRAP
jgi:hypothetical protein